MKVEDDDFVIDDDDFEFDDDVMQEIETPAKMASTNGHKNDTTKSPPRKSSIPANKDTEKGKSTPTKSASVVKKETPKRTPTKLKAEVASSEDEFVDPKSVAKPDKSSRSTPKKAKPSEPTPTVKTEAPLPKTPAKASTKTAAKTAPKSAPRAKKSEVKEPEEDLERKAILQSVETVALPDVEPPAGDTKYLTH
jgi:hypothetical protein